MKVWVVTWIEDIGEFKVFSSKERAWDYLCKYYKQIGEFGNEDFNELKETYEEGKSDFYNECIVVVEKPIDEEN